jgi:hypothetical protein
MFDSLNLLEEYQAPAFTFVIDGRPSVDGTDLAPSWVHDVT